MENSNPGEAMTQPAPDPLEHMRMIQAVIARLAGHSFSLKGWTTGVVVVLGGLDVLKLGTAAWAVPLPILLLALLDSYYLDEERRFRRLHDAVRTGQPSVEPFCMDTRPVAAHHRLCGVLRAFLSTSILPFHAGMIGVMWLTLNWRRGA